VPSDTKLVSAISLLLRPDSRRMRIDTPQATCGANPQPRDQKLVTVIDGSVRNG